MDGADCLFSDPTRYAYGDAWQHVFDRMPQLLEYPSLGDYEANRAGALLKGQANERQDKERVEAEGGRWPEDALFIGEI